MKMRKHEQRKKERWYKLDPIAFSADLWTVLLAANDQHFIN